MWASEQQQKDDFALEWLRNPDPFKAALAVVGTNNAGKALQISAQWIFDEYVLNKKKQLIEENGEEAYLPSKADLARKIMEVHENARFPEDKIKALALYASIMGFVTKPDAGNKIGNGIVAVPVNELDAKL